MNAAEPFVGSLINMLCSIESGGSNKVTMIDDKSYIKKKKTSTHARINHEYAQPI